METEVLRYRDADTCVGKGLGIRIHSTQAGRFLSRMRKGWGTRSLGTTSLNIVSQRAESRGISGEFELNSAFYKGGATDGDTAVFATPD